MPRTMNATVTKEDISVSARHASRPAQPPTSYRSAVVASVCARGLASRASILKDTSGWGFNRSNLLGSALRSALAEGRLVNVNARYRLGSTALNDLDEDAAAAYEDAVQCAEQSMDDQRAAKTASRARAEATYASNLRAAGGLSSKASRDRAQGWFG